MMEVRNKGYRMKRRILTVVVLYKMTPLDSVSYRSLLQSAARLSSEALDLGIILYDNTPTSPGPHDLPPNVRYIPSSSNSGLATAYNLALKAALDEGYDWLLTLDQDTDLPVDTLALFLDALTEIEQHPHVAAVVPKIRASGRIVSPNYFAAGAWPRWFPATFTGISEKDVYAFNSGSLLRATALRQVGGYSPWFWLDNSDSHIYRQLSKFGKRVYIAGKLEVDHDFSMLNLQERVSPDRYKTILLSESAFWDSEMNALAGMERTAKLIGRFAKHLLHNDDPALRKLTVGAICARLFLTRRQRLEKWRSLMEADQGPLVVSEASAVHPRVSACVAFYNSDRYVKAQLDSIVSELTSSDEIIVVDDCSTDGTIAAVRQVVQVWKDSGVAPKITLIQHGKHQGKASAWRNALRSTTGDIILLSNEDLWHVGKLHKVLDVFIANARVRCLRAVFNSLDDEDLSLHQGRTHTSEPSKTLLHRQFHGSTIAIRSSQIEYVLR